MSEFQEKHSIASLIGAPPGYVGFDDGNVGGGKLISDISNARLPSPAVQLHSTCPRL
jgi:hypothetical protein